LGIKTREKGRFGLKKIGYLILYTWVKLGMFAYYRSRKVHGLENIPKNGPLLFLGNHQNALLDSLQLVLHGVRQPYFLARSDVFANAFLKRFLTFIRMLPIYRIRDGVQSLQANAAIFQKCADLLGRGEALAMFPEGNHSLKRRVRPLSKGFTRIVFKFKEDHLESDVYLQPFGVNYQKAGSFPDRTSLYFGQPVSVNDIMAKQENDIMVVNELKSKVHRELTGLTTHIDSTEYERILAQLQMGEVDFTQPEKINALWPTLTEGQAIKTPLKKTVSFQKVILIIWNFLSVLPWRWYVKPKVKELEFLDTMRFGYALLMHSILYLVVFVVLLTTMGPELAFALPSAHFLVNLVWVKTFSVR
jgi:1-acyl-sn-glycerol-3-phosphate acyltransferase